MRRGGVWIKTPAGEMSLPNFWNRGLIVYRNWNYLSVLNTIRVKPLFICSKCFLMVLSNHSFLKSQIRFFKEDSRSELVGNLKAINHILGKNLRIWVYFIGIFKIKKTAFMLYMLMIIVWNSIVFFLLFFSFSGTL